MFVGVLELESELCDLAKKGPEKRRKSGAFFRAFQITSVFGTEGCTFESCQVY